MTSIKKRRRPPRSRRQRRAAVWRWAGFIVAPAILVALVIISSLSVDSATTPDRATAFLLNDTYGQAVSLDETLDRGDALLYFSMGVGCDGCFAQIPELEDAVAERGMTLVPIMVDPAPLVAAEAARFGIHSPILIDPGARVSRAYGMVGVYGHGDRPSHSFALVTQDGDVAWVRHYAEMFVPASSLLDELDAAQST